MTVEVLIRNLKTYNPEQTVTVWDPLDDRETAEVYLSETEMGLLIADSEVG